MITVEKTGEFYTFSDIIMGEDKWKIFSKFLENHDFEIVDYLIRTDDGEAFDIADGKISDILMAKEGLHQIIILCAKRNDSWQSTL